MILEIESTNEGPRYKQTAPNTTNNLPWPTFRRKTVLISGQRGELLQFTFPGIHLLKNYGKIHNGEI
jgi:WD40 repeat protein